MIIIVENSERNTRNVLNKTELLYNYNNVYRAVAKLRVISRLFANYLVVFTAFSVSLYDKYKV